LARLLLAHLAEPLRAVEGWAAQLAPGGVLALEEVEAIRASEPIFADYLALQARLLAARGHDLYLGARLRALSGPSVRQSRAVSVSPAAGEAAAMFALNFTHWRRDPWTLANATPAELERLSAGLESLLGDPTHGRITWTMRQVILQPR
ncbi:MAG: osmotically inducible protein OsmC, partial [Acidimicrobiales bacterium]